MGTSQNRLLQLSDDFWDKTDILSLNYVHMLDKPFSENEVKEVIFACNPSKASSSDGFSFLFYQIYWEIIKIDVMKLVHVFYYNILDISKINLATICLIPKKKDASLITQYKSISLINYSFKIITKLLATRLALCMNSLISYTQTAYIKGRNILDNVVVASDVLHRVKIKKNKGILFKIDFEKVFDRVNWDFSFLKF
jgi:Reverse transcriptase (RNA-dependent DNA polymerase)